MYDLQLNREVLFGCILKVSDTPIQVNSRQVSTRFNPTLTHKARIKWTSNTLNYFLIAAVHAKLIEHIMLIVGNKGVTFLLNGIHCEKLNLIKVMESLTSSLNHDC